MLRLSWTSPVKRATSGDFRYLRLRLLVAFRNNRRHGCIICELKFNSLEKPKCYRRRAFQKSKARARRPHTSLFIQQLALTSTPLTLCPGLILPTPKTLYLRMLGPDRSRRAMRAWQAVLASFLFFAPSVTNAETIQISDDRGGLVLSLIHISEPTRPY